jgi:hypothetical protein
MAFNILPESLIEIGKPLIKNIFTILKGNDEDLNDRVNSLEGAFNKIVFYSGLITLGSSATSATGLMFHRVQSDIDLTDAKVAIFTTGTLQNILQIDVKKSSSLDFTGAVSLFTTRPSIDFDTASDYDESTNAVIDTNVSSLQEGDYLRFDITALPTNGTLGKFTFYLIGEPS